MTEADLFKYNLQRLDSCFVLELSGVFYGRNLQALKEEVKSLAQCPKAYIIFDLFDVTLMDSAGLGFLVRTLDMIRSKGGNMSVCRVDHELEKIFSLIRLPIADSIDAAVEQIRGEGEGT
ncbi:STAS domain-containing protein [bacterium]|jgi:anti-anti-sigma factor|nr:STAS domain-containing protein [bacterium]